MSASSTHLCPSNSLRLNYQTHHLHKIQITFKLVLINLIFDYCVIQLCFKLVLFLKNFKFVLSIH